MPGAILVLSGPSGAGKSTIIHTASDAIGEYYFSISTTTRSPRVGESDGKDYFFVSRESFEEDIKLGNFLEYAQVHGNYYGTSLKPVEAALKKGKLVIFDIDVQGHRLIREKLNGITTSVFVTPPTLVELEERLHSRRTDDDAVIQKRLSNATEEICAISEYDFVIVNGTVEQAATEFIIVANAARLKCSRDEEEAFIKKWLGDK
ncbi:MAG: guanylate kinase [Epsilonproteobacteria bacterium]|nr:MAG: guanylate kinase [Campylobacterota bacterium]